MFSYLARRAIGAFECRWNYDCSYIRELLDEAGLGAVRPLAALGAISKYRRDVPASVYYAAKLTASLAADCGPCAQLVVSMAQAEGVDASVLRALVASEPDLLAPDERLGYELARATLARESATEVRTAVVQRWGQRGLASLAYGLVAAQAYPTFKYAIGRGHACTRLRIDGADLPRAPEVTV